MKQLPPLTEREFSPSYTSGLDLVALGSREIIERWHFDGQADKTTRLFPSISPKPRRLGFVGCILGDEEGDELGTNDIDGDAEGLMMGFEEMDGAMDGMLDGTFDVLGKDEIDGDVEGRMVGGKEMEGATDGVLDGILDGCIEIEGKSDGKLDGTFDGWDVGVKYLDIFGDYYVIRYLFKNISTNKI